MMKQQFKRWICAMLAASGILLATAIPTLADDRPDGGELASAGPMMLVIGAFFVIAALGILWSWRNGELKEPEEVKYEMLDMCSDEEDYWSTPEDGEGGPDDEDGGPPPPTGDPDVSPPEGKEEPVPVGTGH